MTKQELQRVQLLLDKKLFQQLRRYAFNNNSSNSEIARRALKMFFDEIKNKQND